MGHIQSNSAKYVASLLLTASSLLCCHLTVAQARPSDASPKASAGAAANADFLATADEVLLQMSEITHLSLQTPLKKTLRSREEIRAYVLRKMKEDKTEAERDAGEKSAQAFGLLPKDFQMEPFLVDLLRKFE